MKKALDKIKKISYNKQYNAILCVKHNYYETEVKV